MTKVPEPVHPAVTPVKFQLPLMVLSFTIPCVRVSVLPLGVPEAMVNWKVPVIFPLTFPLRTNDPVSDPPEVKQGVEGLNVRLLPVTVAVPLLCVKDKVKAKAGVPSLLVNFADQFPATLFAALELTPEHPASISATARRIAIPNCFIDVSRVLKPKAPSKVAPTARKGCGGSGPVKSKSERPARRLSVTSERLSRITEAEG